MKRTKREEEEEKKALPEEEKLEKLAGSELKPEKPEEPEPEKPESEKPEELSDAVKEVYKHNFANCHLTLTPPEEIGTQRISIILQKPIKKPWGFYRTTDAKIKKLIEKSHYFGRESGFRILKSSEAEAKKVEGVQAKSPKYKVGVSTGIK